MQESLRKVFVSACVACLVLATGCEDGDSSSSNSTASGVNGHWELQMLSWDSGAPAYETATLDLTQSGNVVRGTYQDLLYGGTVSGSISGDAIEFSVVYDFGAYWLDGSGTPQRPAPSWWSATVSGNQMSGNVTINSASTGQPGTGTWSAERG